MIPKYTTDAARWAAVKARDVAADECFVYCVKTTKIFCRPTCKARLARRSNVELFCETSKEAEAAGYRACKRCRPELVKYVPEADRMIEQVRETLDDLPPHSPLPKLEDLAAQAGLTKHHFHRCFKKATGLTPREYALSKRHLRPSEDTPIAIAHAEGPSTSPPSLFAESPSFTMNSTPDAPESLDLAFEDWLSSSPDDTLLFDGDAYNPDYVDESVNMVVSSLIPIDSSKEVPFEELTILNIHYDTVQTTRGILLLAFDASRLCKLELVRTLSEAATALGNSFPAPFYHLAVVADSPVDQKVYMQQQILEIAQAIQGRSHAAWLHSSSYPNEGGKLASSIDAQLLESQSDALISG